MNKFCIECGNELRPDQALCELDDGECQRFRPFRASEEAALGRFKKELGSARIVFSNNELID